jgi:hypothetical protein
MVEEGEALLIECGDKNTDVKLLSYYDSIESVNTLLKGSGSGENMTFSRVASLGETDAQPTYTESPQNQNIADGTYWYDSGREVWILFNSQNKNGIELNEYMSDTVDFDDEEMTNAPADEPETEGEGEDDEANPNA